MKAVMYGAGNIGRGFIGQLLSQSGYSVSFIDVNMQVIDALNERGEYTVEILENESNREVSVKNVCGVNGMDAEAVADAIANADVMATAVGVNILPRIAGNIANGLKKRWENGKTEPFNVIICENLIGADAFLAEKVKEHLSEDECALFDKTIGMVEASIGRMVPLQTEEMTKGDILRVCVEPYCNLVVDKDAFKGEIPAIENMSAYPKFQLYIERKLFIHNMGHSMTAYFGNLKGYEYIWQAIEDAEIRSMVLHGMMASAVALAEKYEVPVDALYDHVGDLIYRFTNRKLGDTVFRVGRDLNRKLSPDDRLVGAMRTCKEMGIKPVFQYAAIASAMQFTMDEASKLTPDEILTNISGLEKGSEDYNAIMEFVPLAKEPDALKKMTEKALKMISVKY
ncbi:MAG: mannitol dehydrogenase [Clostridia bacterium]|nr:mannitol dehydrogenase [Clostridia bacterium]